MISKPERVLASLRDVAGVEGSWLFGADGQIQARDLSALFPDTILAPLGLRFVQMMDVTADHLPGCDEDLSLHFKRRTLHLRRSGPLTLVVLTLPTTNFASLRIGIHLVFRQLYAPVPAAPAPVPATFPVPTPRPNAPRPAPVAAPRPAPPAARPKSNSIWGD